MKALWEDMIISLLGMGTGANQGIFPSSQKKGTAMSGTQLAKAKESDADKMRLKQKEGKGYAAFLSLQ